MTQLSINHAVDILAKRTPPLEAPSIADALACARPVANEVGVPIFGNVNFHQLMIYIAGPCLVLTVISSMFLIWKHLHRYTVPQEQRQIIRIASLPIFYALFNFLAILWYPYYLYLQPIADIFEAIAVAALFFLVLEYVAPDGTDRDKFFASLEARNRRGQAVPGGSLAWYQNTWSSVLQYPLTKLVFTVIVIVTQRFDVYCENSFSPKYAHLYLQIADWLFIGGALGACIRFVRRFRSEGVDPKHKMRAKAWSLVIIILFQVLQDLVFHLLSGKFFKPNERTTYNDIYFGLPSFMTCVEAVIFSFIFLWSYSSSEYKHGRRANRLGSGPATRTRTFRAIRDAINISDIVAGTWFAFQLMFKRTKGRFSGLGLSGSDDKRQVIIQMGNQQDPTYSHVRVRGNSYGSRDLNSVQTEYGRGDLPTYPAVAQDPSLSERMRASPPDGLRPLMQHNEHEQRLELSRDNSPINHASQQPRSMV